MSTVLLSPARVARTLDRLACEVVEHVPDTQALVLCGILRGGEALAHALAERLAPLVGHPVPVAGIDVAAYRDDREPPAKPASAPDLDVQDRHVLLVDDVLHTGRTVRAALDAVVGYGRPRTIRLAVLVDRGGREYPIQPDYVGRELNVAPSARVQVHTVPEISVDIA